MARDQHGPKAKGDNISWQDVTVLLRQMQTHMGMRVDIHIFLEGEQAEGEYTRIEVRAFNWTAPWINPKHKVSGLWETRNVATMTGYIVRLLHQLDHVAWHQTRLEDAARGGEPGNGA